MYGKRVVVIGIGNSGGDIAVEGSRVAEQVGKSFLIAVVFLWYISLIQDNSCSRSAGVCEHSSWCLGHPSGFWQRPASGHVQHTLCPHPVQTAADAFSKLAWREKTQLHVWSCHVWPQTQTQVGFICFSQYQHPVFLECIYILPLLMSITFQHYTLQYKISYNAIKEYD